MDLAQQLQQLYGQFGHVDGISIELHKELIAIAVENDAAQALIFLQGAQVAEFQAKGQPKTLWLSDANDYKAGIPLRGGIPICWPWFGDLANNPEAVQASVQTATEGSLPAHGFARELNWQLSELNNLSPDKTQLIFTLDPNNSNWPHLCSLSLAITIGSQLELAFEVKNLGEQSFSYSAALHSYFAINHLDEVSVHGIEGCNYLDNTDGLQHKKPHPTEEDGGLAINEEIDRIYLSANVSHISIKEPQQRTEIISSGSHSTVVWNPGAERAKTLSRFKDDDYQHMLCIETANAADDFISLAPQQSHTIELQLSTQKVAG